MGWARAVLVTLAVSALQHDQYDERTRKNDESGNVIEPPLSHVMGRIDAQPLHPKTTKSVDRHVQREQTTVIERPTPIDPQ